MTRISFTLEEKKEMLIYARSVIQSELFGTPIKYLSDNPKYDIVAGVFVTLKKFGELRGCIGYVVGVKPLREAIKDMAIEAAFNDPRFTPLQPEEFDDITIEISILTPLERVYDLSEIEVGKHGLFIKRGFYSGLLLPQVAVEYNWDREEFLQQTCRKAGLEPLCYLDEDTEIYKFSAIIFSEEEIL